MRRTRLSFLMLLLFDGALFASQPNFIVIFFDELGDADNEPLRSTLHRTPNLSSMAKKGVKLTSFYST